MRRRFNLNITAATLQNLRTTSVTQTTIALAWDVYPGATGYEVRRNGTLISTPAGTTYSNSGHTAGTQYTYAVRPVVGGSGVASAEASIQVTTAGSGAVTYTPTHYVAPFSSVSGATNDTADLGAAAWESAANAGTPTTLGTAMARATAGNRVRVAAGVYSGTHTNQRLVPVFRPANSGTAGNPIVFFAQYPAATNYGSTSLYSELRHNGVGSDSIASSPAMGSNAANYVIFDGFYAKFSTAYPAPSGGIFHMSSGATGCEFRRLASDCDISIANTGTYNPNTVWIGGCNNWRVTDCRFEGNPGTHGNGAHLEVADPCNDFIIENCTSNAAPGSASFSLKGGSVGGYMARGTVRFNRCTGQLLWGNCDTGRLYQNLIVGNNPYFSTWVGFVYYPDGTDIHVFNNTFVLGGTYAGGFLVHGQPGTHTGTTQRFYNNIVTTSGAQNYLQMFSGSPWGDARAIQNGNAGMVAEFDQIDGNVYFTNGGTARFTDGAGTTITGLANWKSHLATIGMRANAREAATIEANPLFIGGGDYRLQAGSPAAGKGCYITGTEEIGVRANPTY